MRQLGWILLVGMASGQKVAITLDDLPLNGELPPGVTRTQIAQDVVKILKKSHLPPAYGFINAAALEGDADGAEALKIWAAQEPMGNHTYTHMNLAENTVEIFERNVIENEPALELLKSSKGDWHWFRYPFLAEGETREKRHAIRDILAKRGYKIAQVTMSWDDYLWNSAAARCQSKNDAKALEWLHSSYLSWASASIDRDRELAKLAYGRDINHVLLLHLGAFSATILPEVLDLLKKKGLQVVSLEEAESDPVYAMDPDLALKWSGTLVGQMIQAKKLTFPQLPERPKEVEEICK